MKRSTSSSPQMHSLVPPVVTRCIRGASIAVFIAFLLSGCGKNDRHSRDSDAAADSAHGGMLPALAGSVIIDSLRADIDGDGAPELIVASRVDDQSADPLLFDRYDRIDIYAQDADGYHRVFVDPVDYGSSLKCEDLTGDGIPELLVRLDAGGNNPIATQGLHIYGLDSRRAIALLFYSASGAPVLRDLDNDGRREVLVSDQFWGMMAHSEVIGYTREVYAFAGDSFELANASYASWFDEMLTTHRRAYEQARRGADSEEGRAQLYLQAAEYLVWNLARGGTARLNRVWQTESAFLRQRLGEAQYDDLEAFVDEVTIEEQERRQQRVS